MHRPSRFLSWLLALAFIALPSLAFAAGATSPSTSPASARARQTLHTQMASGNLARAANGTFERVRRPDGTLTPGGARVALAKNIATGALTRAPDGRFDAVRRKDGTFTSAGARSTLAREIYEEKIVPGEGGRFAPKSVRTTRLDELRTQKDKAFYTYATGRRIDGTFTDWGARQHLRYAMANGVVVRNATTGRIMNPVAAAAEGAKIAHH